jgi:pyruvate dehydrogenase E2 component (dihydrolipoamide acetyltransferase)/2-oxoisovalerate dehydrogenase E2 component (dihydrolipoyl transacylase)
MDFRLPELGEGVYEAEVVNWLVKPGDRVKRGQIIVEVLTDKATMEVPAPFAGSITGLGVEPGQIVKVGQVILSYSSTGGKDEPAVPAKLTRTKVASEISTGPTAIGTTNGPSQPHSQIDLPVKAAPSVRYLARKLGIDLAGIRGTGPEGRVLIGDLTPQVGARAGEAPRPPVEPPPDYGKPGTRIKLHGVRRKIAEHLALAKRVIPHYTYVDECEVTDLVRLRESLRERFAEAGAKLTFLAFFVKAAAGALRDVPIVNATLDDTAGEIILHDGYHIGIAVATPNGLIVPVVRDADRKSLTEIARDIEQLSTSVRAGRARLEDLRGGTFTVTSIGNIGGLFSTPVINHPEVAILGVGKVTRRPVFDTAGSIRPADMVYLSLSFDHRVVDGAVGTAFGNAIIRRLQNPAALLLPERLI